MKLDTSNQQYDQSVGSLSGHQRKAKCWLQIEKVKFVCWRKSSCHPSKEMLNFKYVLYFSYYTLMTFLMMLSVILLSILMMLLSTLKVIRHLSCGSNLNWLLNLNLIYKTLWTEAGSGFLISKLEKLNWFHLTGLITLVLLMWKWMGLILRKNTLL